MGDNMFFIKLFILEFKRIIKLLPRLMAGALVLCAVIALLAVGAAGIINDSGSINKARILLVMPQNDNYISFASDMLKNMESTAALCTFEEAASESDAIAEITDGKAYGAIVFPDNFVRDIVNGKNTPAKIILAKNSSMDNGLFKDLAEGGCGILAAVQSAIYSVQQAYEAETGKALPQKELNGMNMQYVNFVMSREKYYYNSSVSATGDMSAVQYYIVMGMAVILLLAGMSMGRFMLGGSREFYKKVRQRTLGSVSVALSKQLCLFVFYCLLFALCFAALYKANMEIRFNILGISMALWLSSVIVMAVYILTDDTVAAALILFTFTILTAFLGGAFLPPALLPRAIRAVTPYSPVNIIAMCLSSIFGSSVFVSAKWLICTAIFQFMCIFARRD